MLLFTLKIKHIAEIKANNIVNTLFINDDPSLSLFLEPVHIKIASKIIAKVRFPKYRTSSLS